MIADAYATKYGEVAQDFLSLVVEPSLTALDLRRIEIAAQPDQIVAAFHLHDHRQLIVKTSMALCLGIQSLWEQQLRAYLCNCGTRLKQRDRMVDIIRRACWGGSGKIPSLNQLFREIRGLSLEDFESYQRLDKLQLLGNVCRHGEGGSATMLRQRHPELWPEVDTYREQSGTPAEYLRPIDDMLFSVELLRNLVNAVELFWLDMRIACTETLIPKNTAMIEEVARLEGLRPALL